jgi:NTP pyrophosphatase (non-canonical NTP hydrolase)
METELKKNDFRGGWRNQNPEVMMAKLWDEVYDLDDQVEGYLDGKGDREQILKEAVDVANYAMFVADICLASMGEPE